MTIQEHWSEVYEKKNAQQVSWYQPHLSQSLTILDGLHLPKEASLLDVGGGASTWVDDVLSKGYSNISVLDLAESALQVSQLRLGAKAENVHWLVGNICEYDFGQLQFDFWHDRAVFHFLTDESLRKRYVEQVRKALKPGGFIVVATFGENGPERCSGLPVQRYSPDRLHAEFGGQFSKQFALEESHQTPWGSTQEFIYCLCKLEA